MAPVKREIVDDAFPEEYNHLSKRSKQPSSLSRIGLTRTVRFDEELLILLIVNRHETVYLQKKSLETGGFLNPSSQYNPLDEPSPLGLRLRKSPSLLDLIQMRLTQGNINKIGSLTKEEQKAAVSSTSEKLKASNFTGSLLRIGSWEYKSKHEGDLVAKCYFAKHKLVWEVLDGGLKNKIEIQWSDIMSLKGNYPDDGPGTLDLVLARQPLFFRETNPQPRKHTLWQATTDFTDGQASVHRKHFLQCPPGLLGKHFEKLIQCDPRLNFLSQQKEVVLESPCFEPIIPMFDDSNKANTTFGGQGQDYLDLSNCGSQFLHVQTSPAKEEKHSPTSRHMRNFPHYGPSHSSSVMDSNAIEEFRGKKAEELKGLFKQDRFKMSGLNPSMSMNDLVSHIENQISEKKSSSSLSTEERQSLEILEEISQCLFSDFQCTSASEQSIMKRVNSLCCLMQKDPPIVQAKVNKHNNNMTKPAQKMSRIDSLGELLANLPKIASLPQFLFNIPEDSKMNQTR
ncbi:uncharacterized protein LOC124913449 [Impatiens glandulifera]|uniref:uncharacterized protein LOC124913449 n=1 Tax=Impatiens glandulifera TaxID=253017 RepID=UPI001FB0EA2A|nr:uncharacterized protein LOC124913449 [Impatiens glandulifera]